MERRMSFTEVQVNFDEVLAQVVATWQSVIVECDGVPQGVIMAFEEYEQLKAQQAGKNNAVLQESEVDCHLP